MKIMNILHFTENHRFYIYRDFSMSSMNTYMLNNIYQPMVGLSAISLYHFLYQQVSTDQLGYSELEQQRKLFLFLGIEPSERGRKFLIEQFSKLEAIGLLQTYRKYILGSDDYIYEYKLLSALSPKEFFKNQHLTLLLRDKIGKHTVISLRESFKEKLPSEISTEEIYSKNVSVPFYELFQLNTQVVDKELEEAELEVGASLQIVNQTLETEPSDEYTYADLITRIPRNSMNRSFIENLKYEPEQINAINYIIKKYHLTLQEVSSLLDEDGIFSQNGELIIDQLQKKANSNYRQDKTREDIRERFMKQDSKDERVPYEEKIVDTAYFLDIPDRFNGKCDIQQYNMMLCNAPYTHVLKSVFPGSIPDRILDIFDKIDMNYKLKEEVINVLIHYLVSHDLDWNKNFIDSIASDLLGKQVISFEQAVIYIRNKKEVKEKLAANKINKNSKSRTYSTRNYQNQKPKIPIMTYTNQQETVSKEELDKLKKLAAEWDGQ
ncbi:replication initiation and membrane attachment family protein [Chengkuizengella marina]|uniref:Helicase DnaB n=1 Tax=Chengkuizengella marina TaxID=2507566 RepID=A0A6N9PZB9_9BACL|nr:DnaD domain protein [Chengkuizengella marina]NBI28859.1 helicase DnaB [Chengkuizengella marina]